MCNPAKTTDLREPSTPLCSLVHGIRNQLGIILGNCELVAEDSPDPVTIERLNSIHIAVNVVANAISNYCRGERIWVI